MATEACPSIDTDREEQYKRVQFKLEFPAVQIRRFIAVFEEIPYINVELRYESPENNSKSESYFILDCKVWSMEEIKSGMNKRISKIVKVPVKQKFNVCVVTFTNPYYPY